MNIKKPITSKCNRFFYSLSMPGNFLLSQVVSNQVPSALGGLTSVFGMGTGVSLLLSSPDENYFHNIYFLIQFRIRYTNLFVRYAHIDLVLLHLTYINCYRLLCQVIIRSSPRLISISQLQVLLLFHLRPIYQVVFLESYLLNVMGNLILRGASCLDAFSTYPFQTQLLSYAVGTTTDTPAVCPSRSSRTKDSSSQISYAHDGQGPNCLTTF